jgi:lipoprotein-releasing system ATP-binding protein
MSTLRTNPTEGLLEVHDLVKTFGTGDVATRVLRGLSLRLDKGEMAALLGASGSGKSTLLTILGTLMKPTSGSYVMLGQDLITADDKALTAFRNLHIGFVFQFHNLLPDFTALENVIFPTAVREGRETSTARARGRELLVRMGLEDRVNFPSGNLSGGQKQRVAVARALMNGPELVLADEPTGNLDRASASQVMDLIGQINREEGTSFLISTHDEKIADLCNRQIVVGDGLVTG